MALLEVTDLSVVYRPRDHAAHQAVKHVGFTIDDGEFVGLVGESGSGKSTLGNAVLQLLSRPAYQEGGSIVFDGRRLDGLSDDELRGIRWVSLSTVFQSSMNSLNPVLTVAAQFKDTFSAHKLPASRDRAAELLRMVDLDPEVLDSYPHELSGGMKQRVALALALALRPKLVVLDEPTTGLDVLVQRRILDRLRDLQAQLGFAVLFISHDMGTVLELSDRVMVMLDGELVEQGRPAELLAGAQHPYTEMLLDAYRVSSGGVAKAQTGTTEAPILSMESVGKTYRVGRGRTKRSVTALQDVSLTLRQRTVSALVGQSGSGKSTIARLLLGMERPDSGTITLTAPGASPVSVGALRGARLRAYRATTQLVFQDPFSSLNPASTVAYTLSRPLRNYGGVARGEVRERTLALLEQVGLTPAERFIDKLPHQLSGGQRQRVVIARALAADPMVLIADEPVSMLDVSIRAEVLELLKRLVADRGIAMLYITHDLLSARALADDVTVLEGGRVMEQGPASQVIDNATHPYTQELLAAIPDPFSRVG
ncbi:ABC transporter ATP-binding protein [Leifsonia sp. 21MFCrub1.1]|uniref:ABC transporter ATP-binding protein n=1 Tax=Leifsonia sp. 21MFCrub1.1 TaxID=1798223 RepID=UPI000892967C|nr:ABC transporter ATP-binding protein [Leifsonia sp. 21MFCrub1.1]SEA44674.1 peptide/nickel transport system ATP-binding protein [Leifsonia sp. 21MFCrub1.1]